MSKCLTDRQQRLVQQCERSECFLPEHMHSSRCLQELAIQVNRCIARKSNMATKTIMGFREELCTEYFQIGFRNDDVCFFVWMYEM